MGAELRTRNVSEWEVMGIMGTKASSRTTERYARFRPDYLSEAVEAIDAYFFD